MSNTRKLRFLNPTSGQFQRPKELWRSKIRTAVKQTIRMEADLRLRKVG